MCRNRLAALPRIVPACALAATLVAAGCEESVARPGGDIVASLSIDPPARTVSVSDRIAFTAIIRNEMGFRLPNVGVRWSSGDTLVVQVDSLGRAEARGEGATTVAAEKDGVRGEASVRVLPPDPPDWAGHTCAANGNGQGWCWGRGLTGELGVGDRNGGSAPRLVPLAPLASLATGGSHTCARGPNNQGWCWGRNSEGQLGDGSVRSALVPVPVAGNRSWSQISAGGRHSCGIPEQGAIRCWGWNASGQIGNATTVTVNEPVLLATDRSFVSVAAGQNHTCALEAGTGAAWCWGDNRFGQLGVGTRTGALAPARVVTDSSFVSVFSGANHSCGLTEAGFAVCWGANGSAQIGDGRLDDRLVPRAVSLGLQFEILALGGNHSCGVARGGRAWCWGAGGSGQLGDGAGRLRGNPTAVPDHDFFEIAAGASHTCAIDRSLATWCWGDGGQGQLGDGSYGHALSPRRVSGDHQFVRLSR